MFFFRLGNIENQLSRTGGQICKENIANFVITLMLPGFREVKAMRLMLQQGI
jgi:hypothetical protein